MISWNDLAKAEDDDDLHQIKVFLFQENMRLETERRRMAEEREELKAMQEKFVKDRIQLQEELKALNQKTVSERQRLKEDNLFFEKKMAILQDGFRALEEDRQKFERERRQFETYKAFTEPLIHSGDYDEIANMLFASVSNQVGLRKRYKDLVKIFHPDNLFGDEELVRAINREFQRRKEGLA